MTSTVAAVENVLQFLLCLHSGNLCYKCCKVHSYLTQRQLHSLLLKVTSKYRELTLKVHLAIFWISICDSTHFQNWKMNRKLSITRKRANDHQRVTMLLATEEVRSHRRLLSVSLCNSASPSAILAQLRCSIDGKYNPRINSLNVT